MFHGSKAAARDDGWGSNGGGMFRVLKLVEETEVTFWRGVNGLGFVES